MLWHESEEVFTTTVRGRIAALWVSENFGSIQALWLPFHTSLEHE